MPSLVQLYPLETGIVMRFQLTSPWAVNGGRHLLEVGTVINGDDPRNPIDGSPLPMPPPLEANCLDQEALDYMTQAYGEEVHHLLRYDPSTLKPKPRRRL